MGESFYGTNLMTVTEENSRLMTEAYEQFLDAYITVAKRRRNDPYTEEDLSAQDAMGLNWLKDRFYADPYTTNVAPYKAWSLCSLPRRLNSNDVSVGFLSTRKTQIGERGPVAPFLGVPRDVST